MSLIRPDFSYDRREILFFAWREYRGRLNHRRTFADCLSYAWRLARCARQRRAEGALAREAADAAANATALDAYRASLTAEQRAASDAWLIASCSTDGRRVPRRQEG